MKKLLIISALSAMLFTTLSSIVMSQNETRSAPRARRREPVDQPKTAPKVVPGTTAEMQTPEFWISRLDNPDRVIMTPEQIVDLNEKNRNRGTQFTDVFGDPFSIDGVIRAKSGVGLIYPVADPLAHKTFPADSIRSRIEAFNSGFKRRSRYYDNRNMPFDDDMKQELIDRTNVEFIPDDSVFLTYGIVVKHTSGRVMPYGLKVSGSPGGWLDGFQSGMVDFGQPVAILHVSKDRDWYYILSDTAMSWVPATHVAIGSVAEIQEYVNSDDFIIATCHKVPIYSNRRFSNFIVDFYLGAKVKLLEKLPNGYKVSFPYRDPKGNFGTATGWVKPDANVSVGYQPYTQRNVLNTVFTMLYRPYGWADSFNERDCCGMVRTVLRTFGIFTGRWTSFQLHASDHVYMFPPKTPKEKKYEYLAKCESGMCLAGDGGHISMYLGEVDGSHFVIHSSGYGYTDEDGTRMNVNRVNVNDTELEGGSNIGSWTEITEIKP